MHSAGLAKEKLGPAAPVSATAGNLLKPGHANNEECDLHRHPWDGQNWDNEHPLEAPLSKSSEDYVAFFICLCRQFLL